MSNPKKPSDIGANRTGIAASPLDAKAAVEGAQQGSPPPSFDTSAIAKVRVDLSSTVEPVGTMPLPATLKGAVKAGVDAIKGKNPIVFLDQLGERLAFERTGVRLYEALLVKLAAAHEHVGGPTQAELEEIRDQELDHVGILWNAMQGLGGDPTAITPSADIAAVASGGVLKVLTDPRTTLAEALSCILIAELTDNDAWLLLADLAERLGHESLASEFRRALADEEVHLERVRRWVAAAVDRQAGLEPELETEATLPAP
jgi:hypothetical protein